MAVEVNNKPRTSLYLLISLDGKISTGDTDTLDFDSDLSQIAGVKEGLHQYYDIEKTTDRVSFNSGKVQAKIGVNSRDLRIVKKENINFIVVDNKPHLNEHGCEYFALRSKTFYLITTNENHPAFTLQHRYNNVRTLLYVDTINFKDVFSRFRNEFNIRRVTIQTGGTMNAHLLQLGLIDHVSVVVAPCLIGGSKTQSMIGGESIHTLTELSRIKVMKLTKCQVLKNSYLHLEYDVVNSEM